MLSIIILTCNQKAYTLRLLETLQPWLAAHPDAEVIIVDNASTDGTSEAVLGRFGHSSSLPKTGHSPVPTSSLVTCTDDLTPPVPTSSLVTRTYDLKYLMQERNLGVAGGRNVGLRAASGDTILILDNDTEVNAEALDGMLRHLDENPQCGLCAPALRAPSGALQDSAKPFPGVLVKAAHILRLRRQLEAERAAMQSKHPFYVIGACQMFRRSLIDEIGLLDDAIFYGPEDADWCMRIAATGRTIDYLPHLTITHHWQRATRRSPFSRLSLLHLRGLLHFYRRHRRFLK